MKKIFLIMLVLAGQKSLACQVSTPSFTNVAVSTEEERVFSYGIKSVDENVSGAVISNCRETAIKRRFVMITFGPEVVGLSDSVQGINFDRSFNYSDRCTIENNPLSYKQTEVDEKASFDNKWKFINECVEVTVTDKGNAPISFPEDQDGCSVKRISSQSAVFNGGFCFFRPGINSEYNVSINLKDSCKNISGYQEYSVRLQDFKAGINYYTSSTYKDELYDLSSFGTSDMRISVNPVKELFKVSDNLGVLRPTFPGDYAVNETHLGKIEFSSLDNRSVNITVPFVVNNICKTITKNNLNSSVCDYSTPFVANLKLLDSKDETLAEWFDGGVASAQWQGIIRGGGKVVPKDLIATEKMYKIEATFSDPYFDFNNFKKYLKNKIIIKPGEIGNIHTSEGIGDIPETSLISDTTDMFNVGEIGDINFPAVIGDLVSVRKKLNSYFSTTMYPPNYEKVCLAGTQNCEKVGKPFIKFVATFKINSDYSLSDMTVERISKLLGQYKKKIQDQPSYICK